MNKWFKSRYNQLLLLMLGLMAILIIRLFSLTVIQGVEWTNASQNMSVKNIHTIAPRGEIKDRYGRVLASNTPSFTVQLNANNLSDVDVNRLALQLISVFEKNGDKFYDNFPITIQNGIFYYTYEKSIVDYLTAQGMPETFTAEQAFEEIKRRQNIEFGVDKYQAQEEMQTVYNIFPPISVKNMKYLEDLNKESFLQKFNLPVTLSAKEAFYALRDKYKVDKALSLSDARKILIIRHELNALGYKSYMPAKIAQGVSDQTIITLEEKRMEFPGVEVVAESVRVYPYGKLASHVLGYLGQISESEKAYYVEELGYNANDMVGKEGLEKAYENTLKGEDGTKSVEVNAFGKLVRVIDETPAQQGKDIYLTIDLELQKTAEAALKQALDEIQVGGTFESKWGNYNYGKTFNKANVGAVVVIDVSTGDILASASYPSYDPNLFATGISKENWQALQGENLRDPLSPLPLFNVAMRTAVQPGSIFKMVTGTTAMASGLDPNRKLYDGGVVRLGNRTYACSVWNSRGGSHGSLNFVEALEVSCNYYFFDIGAGYDYNRKQSLGYKEPISIQKIMQYAQQYGLGVSSGVEIPETVIPVPSEARKLEQTKSYLRNVLLSRANLYFKPTIVSDKTLLSDNVDKIVSWTEENPTRSTILERMKTVGVVDDMIITVTDLCKYTFFNQAKWTTGDELNISIGQGENAYTPLQMANYVATIANGGTLNKVSLIKGIEGQGLIVKPAGKKVDADPEVFKVLMEGMHLVTSGPRGTSRGVFGGLPIEAGGKTGTAQRSGKVNPPDEVEYIKQYLPRINSRLAFSDVEKEMIRLMEVYPEIYTSKNSAIRQAVINLSDGIVTYAKIDAYKSEYDNFAWFVAFAPVEQPKIAVAALIFQGGSGGYAGPVVKEIIAKYMELDKVYNDYSITSEMTQ
jgi:penicillin-binding protein 2